MPLTIETDIPNTTEATNAAHYNLAMLMMVAGVEQVTTERELAEFITRVILLDLAGPTPLVQFVEWVKRFGTVRTNVTPVSKAAIRNRAYQHAAESAATTLRKLAADPSAPAPTGVSLHEVIEY